jgi:epsin
MQDPAHARLNALLATGEGQDTFGNVGDLRIPAQHTTPGVFVNSAGSGLNRLQPSQTGNNPFMNHHLTGMPNNQQNNNPFGGQRQPQSGSLIDL